MLKITLKIILINLYLIPSIFSEYEVNQDGETCENAPNNPSTYYECTTYHTEDTACCFAEIELQNKTTVNRCIPVQKDARFALNYLTIFSFKDFQGIEFEDVIANFQCGQTEGICGMDSPEKLFQCSEHSSTTRSCCFLTTPTYTECILSSEKYNKETKFDLFGGSTVICNSNILQNKNYILIFFLLFIIKLL